MSECIYVENNRRCHKHAVGEIPQSWAHDAWPLCERHIQPKMHPPGVPLRRFENCKEKLC